MIHIYADGSCKPTNPGPAGFGVLIIKDGKEIHWNSTFLGESTNNVAELSAVKYSAEWLIENDWENEDVTIRTDSNYCVGLFSKNWNAKKNVELVEEIRAALKNFTDLKFEWVKGHAGNHNNERVDKAAKWAVDNKRTASKTRREDDDQ